MESHRWLPSYAIWIQPITYFFETYKNNKNIWDALGISGSTKLLNAHIIENYTIDEDDMTNVFDFKP